MYNSLHVNDTSIHVINSLNPLKPNHRDGPVRHYEYSTDTCTLG